MKKKNDGGSPLPTLHPFIRLVYDGRYHVWLPFWRYECIFFFPFFFSTYDLACNNQCNVADRRQTIFYLDLRTQKNKLPQMQI